MSGQTNDEQRSAAVYKTAVSDAFEFLKATHGLDDLFAKSIVLPDGRGCLLPVARLHADDARLVRQLAAWRRAAQDAFPTQFAVTEEGTARWLADRVLAAPDRMLFLVLDRHGHAVGHLGFANVLNDECDMEIDNVVRGESGTPGIMGAALRALLEWAHHVIGPKSISLRVFADNEHAVGFYCRHGFVADARTRLRKVTTDGGVSFVAMDPLDAAEPDREFVRMRFAPAPRTEFEQAILTAGPSISGREVSYASDAARNGWNREWSKYLKSFERAFADYLGVKHALTFSSGTGALHLALLALGVGPGDEVILPDLTWVATGNAVVYCGATPVFADVEPEGWCLDPMSVEALITDRTKAIMPVHLYGHPARMDAIMEIARKRGLYVVEDAAPSIGAECLGRKTGTYGDFAMFSFQGAKLAVTGEGGMLVTNDEALYERVYALWDQGRTPGTFWINETGWKYKMSNIQAALGLAQLERVDQMIEAKRRIFQWYDADLAGLEGVRLNREPAWARSIYWMTSIELGSSVSLSREQVRERLRERSVDTRPLFPLMSELPVWPRPQTAQPNAKRIADRGINLPSGVCLHRDEVAYVCRALREVLA